MDQAQGPATLDLFGPKLPEISELPEQETQQLIELLSKLLMDHHQSQVRSRRLTDADKN